MNRRGIALSAALLFACTRDAAQPIDAAAFDPAVELAPAADGTSAASFEKTQAALGQLETVAREVNEQGWTLVVADGDRWKLIRWDRASETICTALLAPTKSAVAAASRRCAARVEK